MSRTDAHRPYEVQVNDPYNRHRVRRFQMGPMKEPSLVLLYNACGCWYCKGGYSYREVRRRSRHQAQRACREELKQSNG